MIKNTTKGPLRLHGRFYFLPAALFLAATLAFVPVEASALWPFGKSKDDNAGEPYVARVAGGKYVTSEDLLRAIDNLHKSARVGVALSAEKWEFSNLSVDKFLDELIDAKLLVVEAENMELDKDPSFAAEERLYILNQSLSALRSEEVAGKVSVTEEEVAEHLKEKIIREAHGEGGKEKEEEIPSPHKPSEFEAARVELLKKKLARRESEFFDELVEGGSVTVDGELIASIASGNIAADAGAVATVNGDKIMPRSVLSEMGGTGGGDEGAVRDAVDTLVLHKLIDQEALGRNYKESDRRVRHFINLWREGRLIELFERNVISPMVDIGEDEIGAYYKENLDKRYKRPDRFHLRVIIVEMKEQADKVMSELSAGADFAYMARAMSIDPAGSAERGGDIGWVNSLDLAEKIISDAKAAAKGDILGPYSTKNGFGIFRFLEYEDMGYATLNEARRDIVQAIGRKKYDEIYKRYLVRLRDAVSIEINEDELSKIRNVYGG